MPADASEPKPDTEEAAASSDDPKSEDEVRDRFLDALKRKQEQNKEKANSGSRGEAKVHEVHRSTKQKRQFRRKSG